MYFFAFISLHNLCLNISFHNLYKIFCMHNFCDYFNIISVDYSYLYYIANINKKSIVNMI